MSNIEICGKNNFYKYPLNMAIHEIFEQQVKLDPEKIAIMYGSEKLTYKELNARANQLAHYLYKLQVKPENLVGVLLKQGIELVVTILALFKIGGGYVPLDHQYPKQRLEYMVMDSQIDLLITTSGLKAGINVARVKIVLFDQVPYLTEPNTNLKCTIFPHNIAYVIYTSGTSGKPKGILVEHKTLLNLIFWQTTVSKAKAQKITQFASCGFDVSLQEIFFALLNGHELHLIPSSFKKELIKFISYVNACNISTVFLSTSLLEYFVDDALTNDLPFKGLQHIIVAGDVLKISKKILVFFVGRPHVSLINHYGPSETHVVTSYVVPGFIKDCKIPPIGKAIFNSTIYILNENLQLVPPESIGEIYITGNGLARGYINKPGLTAEKFIPNPFVETDNSQMDTRLYKTGDLGRYLKDGNIEFLGRVDDQIKIRGFRVELGEIETTIQAVEEVKQCVVSAREDIINQKILVGYIVLKSAVLEKIKHENTLNKKKVELVIINKCRDICKVKLPDHMQPSQIIILESLPLTINGKINKEILPTPKRRKTLDECEKPVGVLEQKIMNIWSEVLKVETIGANDSFFALGGNSLLMMQVLKKLREYNELINITIVELFNYPTIRELAIYLVNKIQPIVPIIKKISRKNNNKLVLLRNKRLLHK